jgi:hypothetical protein
MVSIPFIYTLKSCFIFISMDPIYIMLYTVLGKYKPLGLMASSWWDSLQTLSMEDHDREAQGFSPKNKEYFFDPYGPEEKDWITIERFVAKEDT